MAVSLFVPDASVLLKWVLRSADEDDREPALALKSAWLGGHIDIVLPTLWVFEVGNVLGLKQPSAAGSLLEGMADLHLPTESPLSYAGRALELMKEHHVTFYDAAYHALAIVRDGMMVTADERYLKKAKGAGHLALIRDWQGTA